MLRQRIVAMLFQQIYREKISAAWMPGAATIGHDRSIFNLILAYGAMRCAY
jgi:hypothetical protein